MSLWISDNVMFLLKWSRETYGYNNRNLYTQYSPGDFHKRSSEVFLSENVPLNNSASYYWNLKICRRKIVSTVKKCLIFILMSSGFCKVLLEQQTMVGSLAEQKYGTMLSHCWGWRKAESTKKLIDDYSIFRALNSSGTII